MIATCPACTHECEIGDVPLADAIFRCDQCGARIVYGELAPRIVVQPDLSDPARPMVLVHFQDAREPFAELPGSPVRLDPQYAGLLAKNIISVVLQ